MRDGLRHHRVFAREVIHFLLAAVHAVFCTMTAVAIIVPRFPGQPSDGPKVASRRSYNSLEVSIPFRSKRRTRSLFL